MHFLAVSGLQIQSFQMTLRKKRKLSTSAGHLIYIAQVSLFIFFGFLPPFLVDGPLTGIFDQRLKPFFMGLFTFCVRRQGVNRFATWLIGPIVTEALYRFLVTSSM